MEEESDFEEVLTETLADMKLSLSGDTANLNEAQLSDLLETNAVCTLTSTKAVPVLRVNILIG